MPSNLADRLGTAPLPEEIHLPNASELKGIVIGLGRQGLRHAKTIASHPSARLIGAVDTDRDVSAIGTRVTVDVSSLVESLPESPDFAIIATPHDTHVDIAQELCERGIPFLKEKPLARSLSEANELLGIPGIEHFCFTAIQRRYSRLDNFMAGFLASAPPPSHFRYIYSLGLDHANASWRSDQARAGGGSLLDMGYHVIARIHDWFGPPDSVKTIISTESEAAAGNSTESLVLLFMQYNSGLSGYVIVSPQSAHKEEDFVIELPGIFIAGGTDYATVYTGYEVPIGSSGLRGEDLMLKQLDYFLGRVRSGGGFADDQQRHKSIMQTINRCYNALSNPTTPLA